MFRVRYIPAIALTTALFSGKAAAGQQNIETVVVTGRAADLTGIAASANEGSVSAADLDLRPLLRPGEIVENIPGVIVTQHSGSGKANQYFLRGFNLDHGTDISVNLDDVPVNMPSHAHGQGYSDLNPLIPELVERVDYKKGPYYADVGDFGAAGAIDIHYYDVLPQGLARVEGGQFGYARGLIANNAGIGDGNLIYALEFEHNNGPWDRPDDARKFDGLLRYTLGNWTLTASGYHNIWNSTDQVADRAISEGIIDRWGSLDTADGGNSGRYALTGAWHSDDNATKVMLYGLHYDLDLFSDFTYFLEDPVHGDQIEQQDARYVFGGKATHDWAGTLFGTEIDYTLGAELRSDQIHNGLFHTDRRVRIGTTRVDSIGETSGAIYIQGQARWTSWLRTVFGAREDIFAFDDTNIAGGNSGSATAAQFSPKVTVVFGPWDKTEFYLNAGYGFHSNDARGVVSNTDPATPLAKAKGAEAGVRTSLLPGLQTSLSFWLLDISSELVWAGDEGTNEASGPTRRYGIEVANYYSPTSWLTIDADYAWSHSRFTDNEPDGDYVPESLIATFDGGIAVHDLEGWAAPWSAGLRLRYFGPRPLTQDNAVRSNATTLVYADLGYRLDERWSVSVSIFNLLNTEASDIDYYYTSRLSGEPAGGVDDIHTHPAEPRELRFALTAKL